MKKTRIDAKSTLKPPMASRSQVKGRIIQPSKPDILPFLREPARETLSEVLDDLSYLSSRNNLDPIDLLETFLHFWVQETSRTARLRFARRLHAARRFGYKRMKDRQRENKKEYDDIADRLIDALKIPQEKLGAVND